MSNIRNLVHIFFFQAEDGIRDRNVTGVQTCALPILRVTCHCPDPSPASVTRTRSALSCALCVTSRSRKERDDGSVKTRSEERRVGKECRDKRETEHDRE